MTEQSTGQTEDEVDSAQPKGWVTGLAVFAAVMMILAGVFQAIAGFVALLENEFFAVTSNYVFKFDLTTWGWIHLVVGVGLVFAGVAVMQARTWARVVGIIMASLSALANFSFIPYYPLWSLVIIALDVFVILALAVYRPESQ